MKGHDAVENLKGMLAECGHWLSQSPCSRAKKEAELKRLYANCAKSAARHGRERSLKMCLETQLVNANLCTSKGNSLLHLAAYNGSVGACQVLLTRGAKAEKRNRHGESTWETARMKGHDNVPTPSSSGNSNKTDSRGWKPPTSSVSPWIGWRKNKSTRKCWSSPRQNQGNGPQEKHLPGSKRINCCAA